MRDQVESPGGRGKIKRWTACAGLMAACLCFVQPERAAQHISLAWNASTDPNVAGYALYYGTNSGNYTVRIDTGSNSMMVVNQLSNDTTYYFVVTAYNSAGIESAPSAEISVALPGILIMTFGSPGSPPIVHFTTVAGHWYELQASSDLTNWATILTTLPAAATSVFWYTEVSPGSAYQRRYYRYIQH